MINANWRFIDNTRTEGSITYVDWGWRCTNCMTKHKYHDNRFAIPEDKFCMECGAKMKNARKDIK